MTILPKSKNRLCVLLWLLLFAIVGFQSNGNNFPASLSGNNIFTGTNTFPRINSRILVDGTKYPATAAGIQSAINDANTSGSREVWLPCGTIGITATINIFHGGTKLIGCGTGKNDLATTPATLLIWTGGGGVQEMINICGKQTTDCTGAAVTRLDGVELNSMVLDCNNSCTYTVRVEKTDTSSFYNVRVRQGATASYYMVDATGIKFYNVGCGVSASYCFVFDWGVGGFAWYGGQAENDLNSSVPLLLFQGNQNNLLISGVEIDATNATFGGYIQVTGFDTNSSFAGAPAGGAGAPSNIAFLNNSYVAKAGSGLPGQGTNPGADIFITGTAANNSANIHFLSDNITGLAGTSKFGWEFDRTTNATLYGVTSSGHTAAGGSMVNATTNELFASIQFGTSSDSARITGAAAGVVADLQQAAGGAFANTVGPLQASTFKTGTASNTDSAVKLAFSAATTASYTFAATYSNAPVCTIAPISPGATTFTITTMSTTTLTVTASGAFTGTVNAVCIPQT